MKNILLLLAVFSVVSCNNDDENTSSSDQSMIGKWNMVKAEVYKSAAQKTETIYPSECEKKSIHEFKQADMTSITFEKENNTCVQTDIVTRKYTFDRPDMKFWYEGEEDYPYYISFQTNAIMIMEDREEDVDGDGTKDIIKRFFKRME